jgi:sulfur-oxidizing protein SoxA
MRKAALLWLALGTGLAGTAHADPASDLKKFREFFAQKFPTVKFQDYADGFYVLPGMEVYREQWNTFNEFPPYELGVANGKRIWDTKFPNGKTFADCFPNKGVKIAQSYPKWDESRQEVRTAEMDLLDCAKANGADYPFVKADLSKDQKARVEFAEFTAHFYSLSRGEKVTIDLSKPGAVAAYEDGKKFWWTRRGQLNFACAHCHMELAGKNMGGNQPLSAALGHPVGWPAQRLEWGRLETIHFRYMTCNSQVRAKPLKHGAKEYNHLQLYETYLSSGLTLTAPAMRN